MYQCVLYTTKYKDELLARFKEFEDEDELVNPLNVTRDGAIYRLDYCPEQIETNKIETFAHVVSDIIQREGIMQLAGTYLARRKDLSLIDKREIERRFITNNYLSRQEGFSALTYYLVYMPILEELKKYQEINIEGWLRFRTSKYKIILQDVLEQCIEDYFVKKDIVKFIKMIREISNFNDPLEDTLHLVYKADGKIKILNEVMQEVTASYIKEYCEELLTDKTLNKEDLIMNVLITVCPRRIVVHQKEKAKHPEFIKTLEGIFGMNIKYCKGCKHCTDNTITIKL